MRAFRHVPKKNASHNKKSGGVFPLHFHSVRFRRRPASTRIPLLFQDSNSNLIRFAVIGGDFDRCRAIGQCEMVVLCAVRYSNLPLSSGWHSWRVSVCGGEASGRRQMAERRRCCQSGSHGAAVMGGGARRRGHQHHPRHRGDRQPQPNPSAGCRDAPSGPPERDDAHFPPPPAPASPVNKPDVNSDDNDERVPKRQRGPRKPKSGPPPEDSDIRWDSDCELGPEAEAAIDAEAEEVDAEARELAQLRCPSESAEVAAERDARRRRRCADYPGLAFGNSIFNSDTIMKFSIIKNELQNIKNTALRRVRFALPTTPLFIIVSSSLSADRVRAAESFRDQLTFELTFLQSSSANVKRFFESGGAQFAARVEFVAALVGVRLRNLRGGCGTVRVGAKFVVRVVRIFARFA